MVWIGLERNAPEQHEELDAHDDPVRGCAPRLAHEAEEEEEREERHVQWKRGSKCVVEEGRLEPQVSEAEEDDRLCIVLALPRGDDKVCECGRSFSQRKVERSTPAT